MKNRRAVGLLNPMRDKKLKARTGEEKGRHLTCDHGLSESWKVKVSLLHAGGGAINIWFILLLWWFAAAITTCYSLWQH